MSARNTPIDRAASSDQGIKSQARSATRFEALDSLRGFAALSVALLHFGAKGAYAEFPLVQNGGLAVPMFFVLSGFVISYAYDNRITSSDETKSFLIRRFGRIYPLHIFTLFGLFVLEIVKLMLVSGGIPASDPPFDGTNSVPKLIASIFLLNAIIPFDDFSWNVPSWSISTEFFAYAVFAFAMLLGKNRRTAVSFGLFCLFFITLAVLELSGWQPKSPSTQGMGLMACLFGFFAGCQTLYLYKWLSHRGWRGGHLAEIGGLALALGLFWFAPFKDLGTILGFSLLILAFAGQGGWLSKLLMMPFPQFLGRISFSIYLVHAGIVAVIQGTLRFVQGRLDTPLLDDAGVIDFGSRTTMDFLAFAYIILVIGVATLTYRFVEVPFRNFFNALADKKPAAVAWRLVGESFRLKYREAAVPAGVVSS